MKNYFLIIIIALGELVNILWYIAPTTTTAQGKTNTLDKIAIYTCYITTDCAKHDVTYINTIILFSLARYEGETINQSNSWVKTKQVNATDIM